MCLCVKKNSFVIYRMKYRHLFFDLDHTLWDFESNAKECIEEIYHLNELHSRGIADFDAFFQCYSQHNTRLWGDYTKGMIQQEELRWRRMWLALLDFKMEDEVLSKLMAIQFLERLPLKKNLFPYTVEILQYLRDKDYILHLLTNGFEHIQHSKLQNANLQSYFKEIITSEASKSLKPNKAIFEYALAKSGAALAESIMIGDNLDADIQGGRDAGLDTVFINHINASTELQPTYIITHLKELENIF